MKLNLLCTVSHASIDCGDLVETLCGRDGDGERPVVRVFVLDVKVRDQGFHDVMLLDMGDVEGPDVSVADLSILRLQWP